MAEKLGEAVLELRTDDTALEAGMAKSKAGANDLASTFVTAGKQAQGAMAGVGAASGPAATQTAAAAQSMARAATVSSAGFRSMGANGNLARIQLLELSHVGTALTGSLIAGINPLRAFAMEMPRIAQAAAMGGTGIKGLLAQIGQMTGIIKVSRDAFLAEEAAEAGAAAAAVELAARRATANVVLADTKVALAEAAIRTATTAEAEAAAQAQLAAALEAVTAAAAEATIAENALAVAQGRAAAAGEASAAATTVSMGALGIALGVVAAVAGVAFGAIKQFQAQVRDDGDLTRYRDHLGLTHKEMLRLDEGVEKTGKHIKELGPVTVSIGDIFAGLWKTIGDDAQKTGGIKVWDGMKNAAVSAFGYILKGWNIAAAGITAGIYGTFNAVKVVWSNFPAVFGDIFISAVNAAIGALNKLVKLGSDQLNGFIALANKLPFVHVGTVSAPQIAPLANPNAGAAGRAAKQIGDGYVEAHARAMKSDAAFWKQVGENAKQHKRDQMDAERDALQADRTPKKPKKVNDHGLQEALDELDAQIRGQWKLAAAYQVSDAAAVKAEALQKAEEDAIKHKSETGVFYEKELQKAIATRAAEGAKQIADLRAEAATRGEVNNAVAAGLIPAAQMQQNLDIEAKLRPLIVAATLADAKGKAALAAEIAALRKEQADLNREMSRTQELQEIAANSNDLERLRLEASLIGASNRERAVAIAQLEAEQRLRGMPGLTQAEQQAFIKSNTDKARASVLNPFQQWAQTIPQSADAINQALQGIELKGFDGLASAIAGVVTGTESLKDAFHKLATSVLADLVEMTVKMLIFKALSSAFGGGFGGSSGGGGGSVPFSFAGFRAGGGLIPAGTFGIVGERGPEPIIATPKGAMVMPNSSLGSIGGGNREPAVVQLRVVRGEMFDAQVEHISGNVALQVVQVAAPTIRDAAVEETARQFGRPRM